MSHRIEEKERRREERLAAERAAARVEQRRRMRFWGVGGTVILALVAAAFSIPTGGGTSSGGDETSVVPAAQASHGGPVGPGAKAPDFRTEDVVSGGDYRLADMKGRRTLLFFSEGVNCQACMVQAAELQKDKTLKDNDIDLVSVTTDDPGVLAQARDQYGIEHPLLADVDRSMMAAYGQLGRGGMGHPETGGHSFVLVDAAGKVTWESAYQEMYVPTKRLLADMEL